MRNESKKPWWPLTSVQIAWILGILFVCSVAIVAAYVFDSRNYLECGHRRPRGSRVYADQRSILIAIESYYIDHSAYPASVAGRHGINAQFINTPAYLVPTFAIQTPDWPELYSLTTPITYMSSFVADPFSPQKGASYAYWVGGKDGQGWILYSTGPDGKYDIVPWEDYDPTKKLPSDSLIQKTYDPTNGADSGGDIYKYKN